MKYTELSDGTTLPSLGLGTWKSEKNEVYGAVKEAISLGYRHIDCAPAYENESEVGDAVASSIQQETVNRSNLWLTSKLWNNAHAPENVEPALKKSLKDLRLDYLDLFLIHWPVAIRANIFFPAGAGDFIPLSDIPTHETWQAMEECVKKGLVRQIGVCNFSIKKLQKLIDKGATPAVNQIELHPYLQQNEMVRFCEKNSIVLTAYAPLGSADRPERLKKADEPSLISNQVIARIAEKHEITPGQTLLSWGMQRETVVIPKSVNPDRLKENLATTKLGSILDGEDMAAIAAVDLGYRYVDGSFWTPPKSPYTLKELWDES